MENRAGAFKTQFSEEIPYQPFLPSPLFMPDYEMTHVLVLANAWIVKLESSSSLIPHIELFVFMYVRKEALMSSRIEGIQCAMGGCI
jgi:hypothetical protein